MVFLDNFTAPKLSPRVIEAMDANRSSSTSVLLLFVGLLIIVVIVALIVFLVIKSKRNKSQKKFEKLLKEGYFFLNNENVKMAKEKYSEIREFANSSSNKKMISDATNFYNKLIKELK